MTAWTPNPELPSNKMRGRPSFCIRFCVLLGCTPLLAHGLSVSRERVLVRGVKGREMSSVYLWRAREEADEAATAYSPAREPTFEELFDAELKRVTERQEHNSKMRSIIALTTPADDGPDDGAARGDASDLVDPELLAVHLRGTCCVTCARRTDPRFPSGVGFITHMLVGARARRAGVGAALIAHAETTWRDWAREDEVRRFAGAERAAPPPVVLGLFVDRDNAAARGFYAACGFELIDAADANAWQLLLRSASRVGPDQVSRRRTSRAVRGLRFAVRGSRFAIRGPR